MSGWVGFMPLITCLHEWVDELLSSPLPSPLSSLYSYPIDGFGEVRLEIDEEVRDASSRQGGTRPTPYPQALLFHLGLEPFLNAHASVCVWWVGWVSGWAVSPRHAGIDKRKAQGKRT